MSKKNYENHVSWCVSTFEAWNTHRLSPFSNEEELIRQVKYLSPLGEAFVDIVRRGEPIWLDQFAAPAVRAMKLEEECRKTLGRYYKRLQDETPEVEKEAKPRRL